MTKIIKDGIVVIPKENFVGERDILIERGIITNIGKGILQENAEIIDAKNRYVIPGLVDIHAHLRDPGGEEEDIASGTEACAKGGVTSVCCMPNTNPCIDNPTIVRYVILTAQMYGKVRVYPIGAMTVGREGETLAPYDRMKEAGIVAISDDGNWVEDPLVMKSVLESSSVYNLLPISHCEEKRLSLNGVINEGLVSLKLGLQGISSLSETIAVARDIILAKETNSRIHIAHISTKDSVEIIKIAKDLGIKVTAEVAPHHFILTEEEILRGKKGLKVNPPLRKKDDKVSIIEGLKRDIIDVIASDHAPRKSSGEDLLNDPFGISSIEIMLPLAYTFLVKTGYLSFLDLIKKTSYNPSRLLGIEGGDLSVGKKADLVIVDTKFGETVRVDDFLSKGKNSPYDGFELFGWPVMTMVEGKIVYARDL
ncbi:MAG: dihydroorotase [bacterium]